MREKDAEDSIFNRKDHEDQEPQVPSDKNALPTADLLFSPFIADPAKSSKKNKAEEPEAPRRSVHSGANDVTGDLEDTNGDMELGYGFNTKK